MTLWFVLALMTMAAIFAVLWPLGRTQTESSGSEIAVYRDQLEELERDRAAGLIAGPEAEAARVEVARRLIAAADVSKDQLNPSVRRRRIVALAAIVVMPFAALSVYLALGSPSLPGGPIAMRVAVPPQQQSIESMVTQVEAHLEKNPGDGRGWQVLAPIYLRAGRYADAVEAQRNAIRILGATPEREADLGEALTELANGVVTAEAKAAFERAAKDPSEEKAQYFLALAAEQDGKVAEAAAMWRRQLDRAAPDAPWRPLLEQSLARVDPAAKTPGPTLDDVVAAQSLSAEQRRDMISGMVAGLAERLKENGSDIDGWLRLARAYMVLGERDKAQAAIADARKVFTGDSEKLKRIEEAARGLGIDG
jgi:cytochrome c-type biogenesis protein CcmH